MNKWLALSLLGVLVSFGVLADPPAVVQRRHHIIGGVDVDAVDWAGLCASVKPIPFTRGGRTCSIVHPASEAWSAIPSGLLVATDPPANCEALKNEFDSMAIPQPSREKHGGSRWDMCRQGFLNELHGRSSKGYGMGDSYKDMPFEQWRARYFTPWIMQVGK